MSISHTSSDDISLLAYKKDLQGYGWETLISDLTAGFSVALLTLPQAVGNSLLAGLPLYCGLFAAIYASIAAAFFGSSRHLVVGPSNAIAVLVQSGIAQILFTYYRDLSGPEREMMALQIVIQFSVLVGILQLLVAGCKLGRLTQFVSHSVVVGYMVGTAIALVVAQLYPLLGIARPGGSHSFYEAAVYLVSHLDSIHATTALLGVGSCLMIILLHRLDRRIPAALVTFMTTGIIVQFFGLNTLSIDAEMAALESGVEPLRVLLIKDTTSMLEVIPNFQMPYFDLGILNACLPVAFAIALVSIMESTSVAKSIAASSGQRLSINQEIFGISLGNMLSSAVGGMPISGSPSRTGINFHNGAQTRFASIYSALTVAGILYCFGHLVALIPIASLAGLLLYTATTIVNPKQFFLCIKATGSDAFVLWLTMLSCLFFSLDVAFYIGIALSITLYLKKAAVPQLKEYDIDENGDLRNIDDPHANRRQIRLIKVEGELFFGAADLFQTTLKSIAEDDTSTKVIILQLKNARDMDATVCLALQQLHDYLSGSGRYLIACGLTWQIWEILSDSGMVAMLGKQNLFVFDERRPHQHMHKVLLRARYLIARDELMNSPVQVPEPLCLPPPKSQIEVEPAIETEAQPQSS